jgi:hypothetical protein
MWRDAFGVDEPSTNAQRKRSAPVFISSAQPGNPLKFGAK